MVEKDKELKQQVKKKQDEQKGISELVNTEGRTVITVELFKKDTYDFKYNGVYIIDRIEVRHQDMWATLANRSKNAISESDIPSVAEEIVKNREGQGIQVQHVIAMIKNEGVDPGGKFPELTDEEKMVLNVKAAKGIDMKEVYGDMTTVLHRLIVQHPPDLKLDNEDDWSHFHPGLGKDLFDRSMALLMNQFSIEPGLKKK